MGAHVLMQSYANCFQSVCPKCTTHYSQGGKFFLPGGPGEFHNRTWLSPHGYASKLLAESYRPQGVAVDMMTAVNGEQDLDPDPEQDQNVSEGSDIRFRAMAAVDANRTSAVVRTLNPTGNTVNLTLEITRSAEAEVAATGKCLGGDGATADTLAGGSLTADNSWAAPTAVSIVRTAVEVGDGEVESMAL